MFFKKFIVGILLILGLSGELYAGFTILSDVGQHTCTLEGISQSECDKDMLCTASQKVCEIALDNLGSLVEGEAIKQIIRYGGQGTVFASKKIAEFGFSSSKSIVNELLGKVGNAMKYNTRINEVKGLSPHAIGSVFADILFGIAVDTYVDNLPQESFDLVRNSGIPGFKTAPTEAIKKSMKRLIMLSKNNFMFLMSPNKLTAARDTIVGDTLILAEIGVDVKDSAVEATGSRLALVKSQKLGEILNLYIEDRKAYFQDPRKQSDKYSMITDFEEKCNAIQLDGLDGFLASLNSGEYSLAVVNAGLRSQCQKYSDEMVEDERTKNDFIENSTYFSKERYGALLNLYFPPSAHSRLWELYEERKALDNDIASDNFVKYSEDSINNGKLLFTLPENTTAVYPDITASQGETVSFTPDYTAKAFIKCVNDANITGIDGGVYYETANADLKWKLWYRDDTTLGTEIALQRDGNSFSFTSPKSTSILIYDLTYSTDGKQDQHSCPLPAVWESSTSSTGGGTHPVKQTGQTTSYYAGDDGSYKAGAAPSYTRSAAGVVTDNVTTLEWQDDYADNGGSIKQTTWQGAIDYCSGLGLDGGGWRLPNMKELESIIDDGRYDPSIDTTVFSNTASSYYWSSTTYADPTDNPITSGVWDIDFEYGFSQDADKTDNVYVRCIRGGQYEARPSPA